MFLIVLLLFITTFNTISSTISQTDKTQNTNNNPASHQRTPRSKRYTKRYHLPPSELPNQFNVAANAILNDFDDDMPTPEPTPRPSPSPTQPQTINNDRIKTPYNSIKTHHTSYSTYTPTQNPTKRPTDSQIEDLCRYTMEKDIGTDFVILFDDSCGLNNYDCNNLLDGLNKILYKLLSWTTTNRVQTMQTTAIGHAKMIVPFDDDELQNNPPKYVDFVNKYGQCIDGDTGTSDMVKALDSARHAFNLDDTRKDVLIIVSVCEDDRREKLCNKKRHLYDLGVEIFVVNFIDGSNAINVIKNEENADMYLKCDSDSNNVCIGDEINELVFDDIIFDCLLPQLCIAKTPISNDVGNYDIDDYGIDDIFITPTPQPTPRPSASPTLYTTAYQTIAESTEMYSSDDDLLFGCDSRLLADKQIDFMIFIDNSCGLTENNCNNLLVGTGEIIYRLLSYPHARITTIQFGQKRGAFELLIDYSDIELQKDAQKYANYIRDNGECRNGGNGETNLYVALKRALQLIDYDKITKFIIISACKDTTNKISKIARNRIETYVINLLSVRYDVDVAVDNMIKNEQDANDYLSCLTQNKEERICVIENNINLGIMVTDFDHIIDDCLMPQICMVNT